MTELPPMTDLIDTLKDSRDFQSIARNAKRWSGSCFVVQARKREDATAPFRFGLTASRKVGNAVVRNRCKRRLREVVRGMARRRADAGTALIGYEVVIIARTCAATVDFTVLQNDFERALRHVGAIAS